MRLRHHFVLPIVFSSFFCVIITLNEWKNSSDGTFWQERLIALHGQEEYTGLQ